MSFLDLVRSRESIRKYQDKVVEHKLIEQCIEAARLAPSARNSQPWKFVVVDDPEVRQRIARASAGKVIPANHFVYSAPVMVVLVNTPTDVLTQIGSKFYDRDYEMIDQGIVAEHFCLQAAELGLGTCMLGIFDEKAVRKELGIPPRLRISLVITLGYPQGDTMKPKKRKTLKDILSYNKF